MIKYVRLFGESIMGLFGKLFCGGVDKNSLIKELAKMRVRNDPMARAMGSTRVWWILCQAWNSPDFLNGSV